MKNIDCVFASAVVRIVASGLEEAVAGCPIYFVRRKKDADDIKCFLNIGD
jgi:hypothetical protein